MLKTLLPLGKRLAKTQILSPIVGTTVLLCLAVTFGATNIARSQGTSSSTVAQSQPTPSPSAAVTNDAAQRLVGQWQLVSYQERRGMPISLIFTQDNKFYMLYPTPQPPGSLFRFTHSARLLEYQIISTTTQPMQIDFIATRRSPSPMKTVFEFTDRGELRLLLDGMSPGAERPRGFTRGAYLLEKVSDSATLPENTEVNQF